jgi:prepilin peptidase CpaA
LIGAIGLQAPFGISLTQALIGMTLGFFAMMPFYALNLMGAADVKVFAVLGAWCGMHALLGLWLLASAAACLHALWLLAISRTSPAALIKGAAPTFEVAGKRSTPYAACLCVPAVAALTVRVVTEYVR